MEEFECYWDDTGRRRRKVRPPRIPRPQRKCFGCRNNRTYARRKADDAAVEQVRAWWHGQWGR